MLQVRYPDGTIVVYNNANQLEHGPNGWNLYTKKDGNWIATIQPSAGVIVEAVEACRVDRPSDLALRMQLEKAERRVKALERKLKARP